MQKLLSASTDNPEGSFKCVFLLILCKSMWLCFVLGLGVYHLKVIYQVILRYFKKLNFSLF